MSDQRELSDAESAVFIPRLVSMTTVPVVSVAAEAASRVSAASPLVYVGINRVKFVLSGIPKPSSS